MITNNNYSFLETNYDDLPLLGEFDVIVTGGGAAGVSAATVSAEQGLNVLLIEHYGFCGGGAVAGLSGTICGMYYATDDRDKKPEQAVFGFTDRFASKLSDMGGLTEPQLYGKTYIPTHDPMKFRRLSDMFLTDAGVNILFHTQVIGVDVEGVKLNHLP